MYIGQPSTDKDMVAVSSIEMSLPDTSYCRRDNYLWETSVQSNVCYNDLPNVTMLFTNYQVHKAFDLPSFWGHAFMYELEQNLACFIQMVPSDFISKHI
jgi:hypothetical protein